jgi:hypothetical protein
LHSCRALSSQPHIYPASKEEELFEVFPLTNHIPEIRGLQEEEFVRE